MCTGDKEVEVVPYGERTNYAKVLKKYRKREKQDRESKMLVTS